MNYSHYDKLPHNSEELYRLYADQAMGKNKKLSVSSTGPNKELTYIKTYTGEERFVRLLQGIALTLGTLGLGLLDQRVWNKFVAVGGQVEKKVLVTNELFDQVVQNGNIVVPKQPAMSRSYEYAFAAQEKLKEGHTQEAITMLVAITKADPKNAFAWGLLGEAVRQSTNKDKLQIAKMYFEKSIKIDPKNAFAHARLGAIERQKMVSCEPGSEAYLSCKNSATIALKKALELNPDDVFALDQLALLNTEQNDTEKLKEILSNLPNSTEELSHIEEQYGLSPNREDWNQFLVSITQNDSYSHDIKSKAFAILGSNCMKSKSTSTKEQGMNYLAEALAREDTKYLEIKSSLLKSVVDEHSIPVSGLFYSAFQIRKELGLGQWKTGAQPKQVMPIERPEVKRPTGVERAIVCQYSQGEIGKIRDFLTHGPVSDAVGEQDMERILAQVGQFGGDQVGEEELEAVISSLGSDMTTQQAAVACAVICLQAVESFFNQGLPKNEREMYQLIDAGVNKYTSEYTNAGLLDFGEVYTRSLSDDLKDTITAVVPFAYIDTGDIPTLPVSTHLDILLTDLQASAMHTQGRACAVLTTESTHGTNATYVIMFDEHKKPALFNSHGETYGGKEQGASLLQFDSMAHLSHYIKEQFYKNEEGNFQLKILSTLR
ncbi:MAG: hypothetical protein JSR46_01470 [Verrucomicrobia bacterium]|nr:hypothetical protein [Verrucomicrobiota bacterium]